MITIADGNLITFLHNRIREDRDLAVGASMAPRRVDAPWPPEQAADHGGLILTHHLAHFSPDRMQLDAEIRAEILGDHVHQRAQFVGRPAFDFGCRTCHDDACRGVEPRGWCATVRRLGMLYDQHPEYLTALWILM